MNYKRENVHPNLLKRCQECAYGGQNIFPDGLDFDPTKNCVYFDDINDDDPGDPDYDCGAYIHMNDFVELKNLMNR